MKPWRLVFPHQLFEQHFEDVATHRYLVVDHDLFFRQLPFHQQKLVLHRASTQVFVDRLRECEADVTWLRLESAAHESDTIDAAFRDAVLDSPVECFEVVDDWLERWVVDLCSQASAQLTWLETPNFLTSTAQATEQVSGRRPRMQHFYAWQRRRLDVLMDGDGPLGGRWSFDEENRKPLPKGVNVPTVRTPEPDPAVAAALADAVAWVSAEFGQNPGRAEDFAWPVTHVQAREWLQDFVEHRLATFGPYEDAMTEDHTFLFHAGITPMLNIGLLDPAEILDVVLATETDLPSLEGFVRQLIGWREYMRAVYVVHGRRLRTSNRLGFGRDVPESWFTATTTLRPLDVVIERALRHGYTHHIERLMVAGNAAVLLRLHPDSVYEWFMTMYVDAYDWVMVPNVYAMSQFAAGEFVTTKPYVSGSAYLKRMGRFQRGDWEQVWDALYWQFVADYREGFAANPRTSLAVRSLDRLDPKRREELAEIAAQWLGSGR